MEIGSRRGSRRVFKGGLAVALLAGGIVTPLAIVFNPSAAGAAATTYTPATPTLATLTSPSGCSGATCAPWNEYQGDSAFPAYTSQSPGTLLPAYTPGGATTSTNNGAGGATVTAPNLAVVPAVGSGTNGVAAYPSGVVGTPGPLDDYCGSGSNLTESAQSPSRQAAGSTLPLAPSYFPHIVRNADGSLTGYFDYRPKDADEALMVATSTDSGKDWTYDGEALEQNPSYCPSADINDDGQGHANVITVGGNTYLYTLARAAGDMQGVGMIVHQFNPTASNPLGSGAVTASNPVGQLPSTEKTGIDPDGFATAQTAIPTTGGVNLPLTTTGSANSTEQLVTGGFVDLTQDPTPGPSNVINCTVTTGSNTMTSCTSPTAITVNAGDLIEQVIGYVSAQTAATMPVIPTGPNTTTGNVSSTNIDVSPTSAAASLTSGSSNLGFTDSLTGSTYNANAPDRVYFNGTALYCAQGNNNPTTKIENCTTGTGAPTFQTAVGQIILSDPIIPATAYETDPSSGGMTAGLAAPDGIVGTVPSYPNDGTVPSGATYVMYTEKELNYYLAGDSTTAVSPPKTGTNPWVAGATISFIASPYVSTNMPSPSSVTASTPVTVEMGLTTTSSNSTGSMVPVTCTGLTEAGASSSLTGCTVPTADNALFEQAKTYIGAPGATTVPLATLQQTGEGSASNVVKLYKNNEDISILRVAWTTNGTTFSSAGLTNGGIVSDCVSSSGVPEVAGATQSGSCTSSYSGVNDPTTNVSPANLNQYATNEGTPGGSNGTDIGGVGGGDADEMRWVGSAGSIITNPDGSYGMFLSGAWAADGDSDSFNQIFYSQSTDGENWSTPTPVISTDYSFSASYNQDNNVSGDGTQPIGISAYYEGRAYGASVVQNPNGTLTMVFAGYRFPKSIATSGDVLGTASPQWTVGPNDLTMYRNILTTTLSEATSPAVSTTVSLATPPTSPVVVGQTETVAATVAPVSPGTGTPTGTVSFSDGGATPLCTGTLDQSTPDTASCSYTYSGPQSSPDNVTAAYGSDSNYASSTSSATPVTVNQDGTTTSNPSASNGGNPANPAVVGEPVTLSSTVTVNAPGSGSPTGTVSFADSQGPLCSASLDSTTGVASCSYTPAAPTTVAGDSINATYGGDANDAGSVGTTAEIVNQDSTTTVLASSPSSPLVGQQVTYTATVTVVSPGVGTPTGSVVFAGDGPTTYCTSQLSNANPPTATCTKTYAGAGNDSVSAAYGGDTNDLGSTGTEMPAIGMDNTTTSSVSADPPSPVVGQTVTLSATVGVSAPGAGVPTGSVSFSGDGASCTGTLSEGTPDIASCTTAFPGTTSGLITATYAGDTDDVGSSGTTTVAVSAASTATTVTSDPSAPVAGQTVTLTATVAAQTPGAGIPTGSVSFTSGSTALCSADLVEGSTDAASCTTVFPGGSSGSITGTYGGDTNFNGSSGSTSVTVGMGNSAVAVTSSVNPGVVGQSLTFTANVSAVAPATGTPSGTVTFAFSDPAPTKGPGHLATPSCGNGGASADTVTLSNGSATCTISGLVVEQSPLTVTASYAGSSGFAASVSSTFTETIGKAPTQVAITPKLDPTVTSKAASFTAFVTVASPGAGDPTGTATWTITSSSGTVIPCKTSNTTVNKKTGKTTCAVGPQELFAAGGPYTVSVAYSGDGNFATSTGTFTQDISQTGSKTKVAISAPAGSGSPATITATVMGVPANAGTPTGTVTFAVTSDSGAAIACDNSNPASLTAGTATCTISSALVLAGSPYSVVATYSGDANFTTSASSPKAIRVPR